MNHHHNRAIGAIILACCLWGSTGTAASFTPDVSSLATGAFAMGGGGLLMLLFSARQLLKEKLLLSANKWFLFSGAVAVAIYPLVFYSAMRLSGVAVGTVISIASAPFFSVLLECLLGKKGISKQWLISFLLGCAGVILLTVDRASEGIVSGNQSSASISFYLGIIYALLAGLTYALYSWAARSMIERHVSSVSAMSGMFAIAAVILLPTLLITGDRLFASAVNISVAIYLAVVPMFIGYLLFGFGLRRVSASEATLITLLEPVVATVMAVLIVGEVVGFNGWMGMALISLCLILQTRSGRQKTRV